MRKEFDTDIPDAPKILGVYCIFSPDSIWKATVFKAGSITDNEYDNTQLKVNNAKVKLFCNNRFQENLINTGNGLYISAENNKPIPGNTYYIEILKDSFPTIISDTASVLPKLQLDSIYILDDPQLNLFSSWGFTENEADKQLNIFFKNTEKYPFIIYNAGAEADNIYMIYNVNGFTYKKKDTNSIENELFFYRCYNEENCSHSDDFNIIKLSYISDTYFDFSTGEYIQDDALHSIISYYPGNVQSNIKDGLGLFASINYIEVDVDTLEVR